ncbi:hypothetical protein BKA93DRAFT_790875 [Sparassis latifolia]|uniref:RING-type domain-containing protein n=1 Tax=Sparassis crispa TaxID=139825 RepID=A0A401GRS5_9APHY|nr:hypothetical protein SCP_0701100 [Sparassis crispa]GBE84928.1 hypothetical protein SCP_0701100 [Sparassis crispa]
MADRPRSQSIPGRPRSQSMTDALRLRGVLENDVSTRGMLNDLRGLVAEERRVAKFANELPKLNEDDLAALGQTDSTCPICLNTLLSILAEEEMALAMDSPAHAPEDLGVTRLMESCGHVFCRKDIRNWMREGRRTCPTCRRPFITPTPIADSANGELPTALWPDTNSSNFLRMPDVAWMAREMFGISVDAEEDLPRTHPESTRLEDHHHDRSDFTGMYS